MCVSLVPVRVFGYVMAIYEGFSLTVLSSPEIYKTSTIDLQGSLLASLGYLWCTFSSLCLSRIRADLTTDFFIILALSSTGIEPDDSNEIPSDVDLSDPFFSQEIDTGIGNYNKTEKATTGKTKKKRKQTAPETEEDRKAKVRRRQSFIDSSVLLIKEWKCLLRTTPLRA